MRFLAAFDKFKDSLAADEVCSLARRTLHNCLPGAAVRETPLTDGGEGFCEILTKACGGRFLNFVVTGPMGDPVEASVGFVAVEKLSPQVRELEEFPSCGELALVEMASAAGLQQVSLGLRDPWTASTLGVGELLRRVAEEGAAAILLGIGGSATNDLGLGALRSLGLRFLDSQGGEVGNPCPNAWCRISCIDGELLTLPPLIIACDVENPLLGPHGAAATYGPQKGLDLVDLDRMDREAGRLAGLLRKKFMQGDDVLLEPGSGAAGGMGFGMRVAYEARFVRGFGLVRAGLGLQEKILESEIILTGEGCFDSSSLDGKGPVMVLEEAARQGREAFLLAGSVEQGVAKATEERFPRVRVLSISRPELTLDENLGRSREFFEQSLRKLVEEEEWKIP